MTSTTPLRTWRTLMTRHSAALLLCLGLGPLATLPTLAHAKNPTPAATLLRKNAPHVYVVKKGDTLWDIAGRFLNRPYRWPEIWAGNRHIRNPHLIYPGDRLLLCSLNGRPLIGKDEGDGCAGIIRRAGKRGATPHVRVEALNNSIALIPLDDIRVWLERSMIVSPDSINSVPYVVGMADNRVLAGEGDVIYGRGNGLSIGQHYAVYRVGAPYTELDEQGKPYSVAIELLQVGRILNVDQKADISTFEVKQSLGGEIRKGDLILPESDPVLPTMFYPVPAKTVTAGGQVIRVLGSIGTAGQHSVVAINRGTREGTEIGHVFGLEQLGEVSSDPKTGAELRLPNQRIGHGMVFRTFDHISYVYVTDSSLPIKLGAMLTVPMSDDSD